MFQSIEYLEIAEESILYGQIRAYLYLIRDTDFGSEEWIGSVHKMDICARADAIIKCYESKKLDVAQALCLFHMKRQGGDSNLVLVEIKEFRRNLPSYRKYADAVIRYHERFNNLKSFW